jgi:hypothetical protein
MPLEAKQDPGLWASDQLLTAQNLVLEMIASSRPLAIAILAARRASGPYPIVVFQRPLIEIVVQGAPERHPTDTPTAVPTPMPSPTIEPTPLPSATIPAVGVPTPTATSPEEP